MHILIRHQKFDGSWEWDQSLLGITGVDSSKAKTAFRKDSIAAMALAIAFFRTRVPHEAGTWELVVDKAVSWLAGQEGIDGGMQIQEAGALLS
ncbi:hypothetical protein F5Y09DRAFT_327587 [Xylaria sp. FL1042]|nr:hypothetical protein F5Y09DRAFT_327587 [Xylaria sp. FL1042]